MTGASFVHDIIAAEGPIGVDRYMALCLGHPVHGYYITRDPFGRGGDFVTAPEISQMFGELLGLWAAALWIAMGRPQRVLLVELGPGRGTLMADALRAARQVPDFRAAITLHLVETSPVLRDIQRRTLAGSGHAPVWHDRLATVPDGPLVVIANEFFDALPIRQHVATQTGWHERLVGLDPRGRLAFGLSPYPVRVTADRPATPGAVLETCEAGQEIAATLAQRVVRDAGAALVIDYGYRGPASSDTLQALRNGSPADPLGAPGEQDLTAHVDFSALVDVAAREGAASAGPVDQGGFLESLGIRERATRLAANASAGAAAEIGRARDRLVGRGPDGMGALFKAMAICHPALRDALPGFPAPDGRDTRQTRPAC